MADYFTSFSCLLDAKTPENATFALSLYQTMHDKQVEEDGSGFGFLVEQDSEGSSTLWIHDGGCGEPEHVLLFVQACARQFGLSGHWGFEWAYTCSKPRLDAFGGCAHILNLETGNTVAWLSTN